MRNIWGRWSYSQHTMKWICDTRLANYGTHIINERPYNHFCNISLVEKQNNSRQFLELEWHSDKRPSSSKKAKATTQHSNTQKWVGCYFRVNMFSSLLLSRGLGPVGVIPFYKVYKPQSSNKFNYRKLLATLFFENCHGNNMHKQRIACCYCQSKYIIYFV